MSQMQTFPDVNLQIRVSLSVSDGTWLLLSSVVVSDAMVTVSACSAMTPLSSCGGMIYASEEEM